MNRFKQFMFTLVLILSIGISWGKTSETSAASVAQPKLQAAQEYGKNGAVISWKKVSGAKGYRIFRRCDGEKWARLTTVKGAAKTSFTDMGLITGTRYYYTVKAYKKSDGGNIWSTYDKNGLSMIAGLSTLTFDKASISLQRGTTSNLKIIGTDLSPTWKTSSSAIASVTQNGKITAVGPGTAVITAMLGGKSFTCQVTVTEPVVIYVWLSKTGECFHRIERENCSGMKNPTLVTLEEAYAQGRRYCHTCWPNGFSY